MKTQLQLCALGMVLAAVLSWVLVPVPGQRTNVPDLASLIPERFGDWGVIHDTLAPMALIPGGDPGALDINQPYDQTLMRTYRNSTGEEIMLAVAYGSRQRQEIKLHRPELCYASQGFRLLSRSEDWLVRDGGAIPVVRLVTSNERRMEPVSYWMRIGDQFVTDGWEVRWQLLKEGVSGNVPDGLLVRASSALSPVQGRVTDAFHMQTRFLDELVTAMDDDARFVLGALQHAPARNASLPLLEHS